MPSKEYYRENRKRIQDHQNQWRKDNPEKVQAYRSRWYNSQRGYMSDMYSSMKQTDWYIGFKNFEEFFNFWLEQKNKYGMKCPATGKTMTMIRQKKQNQKKTTPTNVSKDRILSNKGYTKENLIFVCWEYNNSKNNITPKNAKAFLKIVKERYGTDEIE